MLFPTADTDNGLLLQSRAKFLIFVSGVLQAVFGPCENPNCPVYPASVLQQDIQGRTPGFRRHSRVCTGRKETHDGRINNIRSLSESCLLHAFLNKKSPHMSFVASYLKSTVIEETNDILTEVLNEERVKFMASLRTAHASSAR